MDKTHKKVSVILGNERGRHEKFTMPGTRVFDSVQYGMAIPSCLPRPFSQNITFQKIAINTQQILKNSNYFLAFLVAFLCTW